MATNDPPKTKDYIRCLIIVGILFAIFFYGVDFFNSSKNTIYHTYFFEWEIQIPFIKFAYIFYFGILLLPFTIYFYIKTKHELNRITFKLSLAIVVSGIIFLMYPMQFAFLKNNSNVGFEKIVELIGAKHNLLPSLHVALSLIIILGIWTNLNYFEKTTFLIIEACLIISTLLTYQHHFLDIIGGIILAFIINFINYKSENV